jgi:hypothetical protein
MSLGVGIGKRSEHVAADIIDTGKGEKSGWITGSAGASQRIARYIEEEIPFRAVNSRERNQNLLL